MTVLSTIHNLLSTSSCTTFILLTCVCSFGSFLMSCVRGVFSVVSPLHKLHISLSIDSLKTDRTHELQPSQIPTCSQLNVQTLPSFRAPYNNQMRPTVFFLSTSVVHRKRRDEYVYAQPSMQSPVCISGGAHGLVDELKPKFKVVVKDES